jgi:RNA polymerase sigma-70 factor (ECF subfamily)
MSGSAPNAHETSVANAWFQTTHWTTVLSAGQNDSTEARLALAELCQAYWPPLYSYIRRSGHDPEQAKDLTQEFFARLLEKHWLAQADPTRGKFRSFLLSSVNHFLANEHRRQGAAKRGGGRAVVSLDDTAEALYATEPVSDLTPEKLYERRWALSLFERALARLREDYTAGGKGDLYNALKDFLSVEATDGDYARLGVSLGMNRGAVGTAVHRLRHRYRELVRDEIAKTVSSPAELEDEMRSLLAALG